MSNLPPSKTEFYSPFGGFWTDLHNSKEILQGKLELGWLSDDEAATLESWIDDGYAILKQAVPDSLIDGVCQDIDKVVQSQHASSKVSYWKNGEKCFKTANEQRMREEEAKLLDMHMLSESARQAIFSPAINRFLGLVFERPPVAFQSLTFELGSQQPVHCDVAFVHVSSPREFVASWIALEDVKPGSGELEYYPGSHRLDDHLFAEGSPWASGDLSNYSENLRKSAKRASLALERFLPNKGDVLLWNAGLYHGGSPRTDEQTTRRSLVTHYCPSGRHPMYSDAKFKQCHSTQFGGMISGNYPSVPESV